MAITQVSQLPDEAEGGWDQLWRRTYKRVFQIETDSASDCEPTLRLATDINGVNLIPQIGWPFNEYHLISWVPGNAISVVGTKPLDYGAFVTKVGFKCLRRKRTESADWYGSWLATIEWGPYDAGTFPEDPTQWPITVEFGGNRFEKVLFADVTTGKPICNSAGQRFEEPCTVDDSRVTFTVTRNELIDPFGLTVASQFNDSTNLYVWNNFPAKTVKLGIITADGPYYDSNNQVWYFKVKYPFEVTRTDWQYHPLDQGFSYYNSSTGTLQRAKTVADGQDSPEPVPLDGTGHLLLTSLGSSPTYVFLSFDKYPALDWTSFNIDLTKRLGT